MQPVLPLEISELGRVSSGWITSPSLSKLVVANLRASKHARFL